MTAFYYLSLGLGEGYKRGMANLRIALGMVKTGRMHVGMPHRIKDRKGLKAILAKAHEIEQRQ